MTAMAAFRRHSVSPALRLPFTGSAKSMCMVVPPASAAACPLQRRAPAVRHIESCAHAEFAALRCYLAVPACDVVRLEMWCGSSGIVHPPVKVIAGQGAKGRHLKVGVWVDASGHDQLAACIDDTCAFRSLPPFNHLLCEDSTSRTRLDHHHSQDQRKIGHLQV